MKQKLLCLLWRFLDTYVPKGSFSQSGEDAIVRFLFHGVGNVRPTYLELGTNHPRLGNNTYLFYRQGCSGVLVEADETAIPLIRQTRPRDKVLSVGVGTNEASSMEFYIFNVPAVNTFNKDEMIQRSRDKGLRVVRVVNVQMVSVNRIIGENFSTYPDFLSIDIEGLDLSVLKTLDFDRYPIPVICAETCEYSNNHIKPVNRDIEIFMETKGYFVYANTYINTIFVNENWFRAHYSSALSRARDRSARDLAF